MLLGSGGAGGGSGSFDVHVDALLTASGQVATDAADAGSAVSTARGAADAAGGACGGPLLAAALARLSTALGSDGGQLHDALSAAGTRLSTNAATYTSDDTDASSSFPATFTGVAGLGSTAPLGISAP